MCARLSAGQYGDIVTHGPLAFKEVEIYVSE